MGFFDRMFRRTPAPIKPIAALPAPTELRSLRPQDVMSTSWSPTANWDLEGETDLATLDGASTWVFACVHKLAAVSSSFPWYVQRRVGDGWERDEHTALQPLLDAPNEAMSWQELIESISLPLSLNGNAILSKVRVGKIPVELWPLSPLNVTPKPGRKGQPYMLGYEYKAGSTKAKLETKDVLHFMQRDPSNPYWGAGPLQLCSRAVDVEKSAAEWQKVTFQNLGVPPGAFTFDQHIDEDQVREAKRLWREHTGGVRNARIPAFIGGGAKWIQTSLSPQELDFVDSRGMTREEVCALLRTPPPIVGIFQDATFNNISTAERMYLEHTVLPWIWALRDVFNRHLVPEFGAELWLEVDVSKVPALLPRFKERTDVAGQLAALGVPWNTIDQVLDLGIGSIPGGELGLAQLEKRVKLARELWAMGVPYNVLERALSLGTGAVEGGDVGYLPANVQPVSMLLGGEEL